MSSSPSPAATTASSAVFEFDPRAAAMVSVGAALGAGTRLFFSTAWPGAWTIVAVNVAGCFFLGLLTTWAGRWKPLLGPGFCGGFTTFSAFALPLATSAGWQGDGVFAAIVTVVACPLAYFFASLMGGAGAADAAAAADTDAATTDGR